MLEIAEGRLRELGVGSEALDALAQRLPGAAQAAANGPVGNLEHLGQLGAAHPLPVKQLDEDLQVERQAPQSSQQQRLLLVLDRELRGRSIEVGDTTLLKVRPRFRAVASLAIAEDLPARDGEQKRSKTGVTTEPLARLDAPNERLLDEVVHIAPDLVAKEPVHRLEVPVEERLTGVVIARAPSFEQGVVVVGCHPPPVYVVYAQCVRGWMVVALLGMGCGPTKGLPEPDVDPESANDAPQGAGGDDDGGDDGAGASDPGDDEPPATGTPRFMDSDIVGSWLCTGDSDPFAMHIDDYVSPDISGRVCADYLGDVDPLTWEPCGTLTLEPTASGSFLPIVAEVYYPVDGSTWTVSAGLRYHTAEDTMQGTWLGASDNDEPLVVSCLRL